jgi:hypothetical protein
MRERETERGFSACTAVLKYEKSVETTVRSCIAIFIFLKQYDIKAFFKYISIRKLQADHFIPVMLCRKDSLLAQFSHKEFV